MKRKFFLLLFATASLSLFHVSTLSAQSVDRGFRHPGGLHTQADFDRVRAQIAAGNARVKQAFSKLKSAQYAQSTVQTYPVETIVRGGSGENYINAARGATMAYQNALRWKLEDNKACANAAVRILMAWATTTKAVGGTSDARLAVGLYGYQFAQAAELMRDYEGWSREDFETFRQWMLTVWYPPCIDFLRGRNGTWENTGKWWQAPGHYWSNWGLCNVLCCISIGILCDDVYIYNQGMSYFKYDQVGTFTNPPALHDVTGHDYTGKAIQNVGLTEFLGNLVVTDVESELETGAYGRLGQMNESGRDTGHSSMALGLAVDIAKVGWNQGDDLFAYMNHRLAAGIEFVAAQTQSIEGLPWTPYIYGSSGYYYSDGRAWVMESPALGAQMRPYWGTVIGIYEGVKGVSMPFSEVSYQQMGIDGGGEGSTSGGYDHLGYSVLMNTHDVQLCPAEQVPTELSPRMEYSGTLSANLVPSLSREQSRGCVSGKVLFHNELGGLVNTYTANNNTTVPAGQTVKLVPQLPEGEEDTGNWRWDTGETSRELTVSTDVSRIYRVHYTNARGVESELSFAIAAKGDCTPTALTPAITYGGEKVTADTLDILYGKTATLAVTAACGWGTYKWSTNATTQSITTPALKADREFSVSYTNQGGAVTTQVFRLHVVPAMAYVKVGDGAQIDGTEVVADGGAAVTLGLTLPTAVKAATVQWSTGETGASVSLTDVQTSSEVSATFTLDGEEHTFTFQVLVRPTEKTVLTTGNYLLRHVATDTYMTAVDKNQPVVFLPTSTKSDALWFVESNASGKHNFISLATEDSLKLSTAAKTVASAYYPLYIETAVGTDRVALHTGTSTSAKYWDVDDDGAVITVAATRLTAFPFQLVPVDVSVGVEQVGDHTPAVSLPVHRYDLSGRRLSDRRPLSRGIYLSRGKKVVKK